MKDDKVFVKELIKTVTNYKKQILLITLLTLAFCVQLTFWLPKKYKSSFELNVYSNYFQNPLISEVVSGLYNIPEMRATIDSMVKESISDNFIDELGYEFKYYDKGMNDLELAKNREELRNNFSYFSSGALSYQVVFTANDQMIAKKIADKTMKKVVNNLIDRRIRTIEIVQKTLMQKLDSINASQKMRTLIQEYDKVGDLSEETVDSRALPEDKKLVGDFSSKFYSKYHEFNIALNIEKQSLQSYIGVLQSPQIPTEPMWPKKRLFASLGLILGLIFAFIYVYLKETMGSSIKENKVLILATTRQFQEITPVINNTEPDPSIELLN